MGHGRKGVAREAMEKARFVEAVMMGMTDPQAARHAGISDAPQVLNRLRNDPWIKEQLQAVNNNIMERGRTSRQKVEDIVLEAIDIARMKAEPGDMIRGASELSKMNGYYAAEKKEISVDGHLRVEQMQTMSDAELLELLGEERAPIEAEFERIDSKDDDA